MQLILEGVAKDACGLSRVFELRPIAVLCTAGECPTIYHDDAHPGSLILQGPAVSATSVGGELPSGETLVEIPVELCVAALRNMSGVARRN